MFKKIFRKKDKKELLSPSIEKNKISESEIQLEKIDSTLSIWPKGKIVADIHEVVRELGHGGMGIVYLLRERGSNRFAAAKLPLGEFLNDKSQRQRFTREAQVWTELSAHPNIVRAYDVIEVDYRPCIFMEYINGGSIADRLKSSPGGLSFKEALNIVLQVCWAMAFAHENGHIHRDLKPANLLMTSEGLVKVTDFGLVRQIGVNEVDVEEKLAELSQLNNLKDFTEITQKGVVMGTPQYMAPEQWEGEVSPSVDIYAFGIILCELFCGKRPFDPRTHPKYSDMDINPQLEIYFYKHLHQQEKPLDPSSLRIGLPLKIRDLILCCLSKQPEDRPMDFISISSKLNDLYSEIIGEPFYLKKPGRIELDNNQKNDRAWALIRLGNGCKFRGDLDEALSIYKQSERLFKETNNRSGISDCYICMSNIFQDKGDYEGAIKLYQESLEIKEDLGDRSGISSCQNNLGTILTKRGDYGGAMKLFQKSLKITEELNDRVGISYCYSNMGYILMSQGKSDSAMEFYQKSLKIRIELGDRSGMTTCNLGIRTILEKRGDYEGAMKLYRESLEISEEIGDRAGMSYCYNNIGNIYREKRDYENAMNLYQKSLEIKEEIGDRSGMSDCYINLGNISQCNGDKESAMQFYEKSLDIKEELRDRSGMSSCYMGIGNILSERQDYEVAMKFYQNSLAIEEDLGDRVGISMCYNNMGIISRNRGDYETAMKFYNKSLAVKEELGDRAGISGCYLDMGIILMNRGDNEGAMKSFQKSLEIKEDLNDQVGMSSCYLNIGIIFEKIGRKSEALSQYHKSLELKTKLGLHIPDWLPARIKELRG
jgi:serine/threonine protein kinase